MKHVFTVTSAEALLSLRELLQRRLALSAATGGEWIAGGSVYVDGRRCRDPGSTLRAGQRVVAHDPGVSGATAGLPIVYRDAQVAVVDKPAGMPSQATRQGGEITVEDMVRAELGSEARLLHRLDLEASGLLLVSLDVASRPALAQQVARRELARSYFAVVAGALDVTDGRAPLVIRSRLAVRGGVTRSSDDPRARDAETRVWFLRRHRARSLLRVEIVTGRTHQIRAHLAEQGLPIVGDGRYGGSSAARLALHAHALRFTEPDGGVIDLHSPLPAELRRCLEEG
jgi:23S rRNA pseudouridine1911/1915/1917 synthase